MRVQILAINRRKSDKTGTEWDVAECIAQFDGQSMTFSARLPDKHDLRPGAYEARTYWRRNDFNEPVCLLSFRGATPAAVVKAA